jgi:hypothetical protein
LVFFVNGDELAGDDSCWEMIDVDELLDVVTLRCGERQIETETERERVCVYE